MAEMTMVERVARALCAASSGHWRAPPFNDLHTDSLNNHWRHKARAAIAAMREPTGSMEEAGRWYAGSDAGLCFTAMIDAALKEPAN